jgi:transcriptional regulator with XRE-family HTH domain
MYDPAFRLAWDNDLSFHIAEHVARLRNYRGDSQATVAKAMGTSQSAIARIEGGDENITVRTVTRLVEALRGRIHFAIEPAEINLPHWPDCWEMITAGLNSAHPYILRGAAGHADDAGHHVIAGWSSYSFTTKSTTPHVALSSAEAK